MSRRELKMLEMWLLVGEGVPVRQPDELLDSILVRKGYLERTGPDLYVLTERGALQAAQVMRPPRRERE